MATQPEVLISIKSWVFDHSEIEESVPRQLH